MLVLVLISLATLKKNSQTTAFRRQNTQNVGWMKRQFSAFKPLAANTHLCSTVFFSYSNRKCKKSPFLRTAAHMFVSPGDAPATIT